MAVSGSLNLNENLDALSNVFLPNPADGEVLTFQSSTQLWIAGAGGGGGGEANTTSNVGGGEGLALPKVVVDLPFKSLIGGTGITLSSTATEITITSTISQSPWLTDIDADNNTLFDLDKLIFDNNVDAPVITNKEMYADATGIFLNVPTSNAFRINVNGVLQYQFTASTFSLTGNAMSGVGTISFQNDAAHKISETATVMTFAVGAGDTFSFDVATVPEYTFNSTVADWNNNDLINLGVLDFVTTGTPTNTQNQIYAEPNPDGGIVFNVPTDDQFTWTINGVDIATFNIGNFIIQSADLQLTTGQLGFGAGESIGMENNDMVFNITASDFFSFDIAGTPEYTFDAVNADWLGNNLINVGFFASNAADVAQSGLVRLGNGEAHVWRNNADTLDDGVIEYIASDIFNWRSKSGMDFVINGASEYSFRASTSDWTQADLTTVGLLNQRKNNTTAIHEMEANHTVPAVGQVISQIDSIDDDDGGTRRTYTQIRSVIFDPLNTSIDGELILSAVTDNTLDDYISLNLAGGEDITFSKPLDMSNLKIAGINPTTITDFSTVTAATGDFIWIIDATDGLSKKVNASDFLAGAGDMVLADAQTNTGIKTFLDTTMKLRNVANTFDAFFVNTVTAERIYTLPDFAGTVLISGNAQIVTGDISATAAIVETQLSVAVGAASTVLTSNGVGSAPTYQAPTGGEFTAAWTANHNQGGSTFSLEDARFADPTDNTKTIQLDLSGMTTAIELTISTSQSTAQTLTIPNITAADVLVTENFAQTFSNKTNDATNIFTAATGLTNFTGLGAQAQDLNMNGNSVNLGAAGTIFFSATDTAISEQAGSMFFDVPTTEAFSFDVAGVPEYTFDDTQLLMNDNILNMGDGILRFTNAGQTIVNSAGDLLYDVASTFAHQLRVNDTIELEVGGTAVTLATNNLILTAGFLQFSDVNTTITDVAGIMQYDVASTFSHDWRINNTLEAQLTATIMNLPNAVFQEAGVPISSIGIHDLYFDGGSLISITAGTKAEFTIGTGDNRKGVLAIPFANGANQFATLKIIPPRNYNNGTITVVVHFTPTVTGTGNVVFGVAGVAASDGDDLTATATDYGTEILVTDAATTLSLEEFSTRTAAITLANTPVDGDAVYLRIQRRGGDAGDTFTQPIIVLGMSVAFETDAAVAA